jgi:hypothetical protein
VRTACENCLSNSSRCRLECHCECRASARLPGGHAGDLSAQVRDGNFGCVIVLKERCSLHVTQEALALLIWSRRSVGQGRNESPD